MDGPRVVVITVRGPGVWGTEGWLSDIARKALWILGVTLGRRGIKARGLLRTAPSRAYPWLRNPTNVLPPLQTLPAPAPPSARPVNATMTSQMSSQPSSFARRVLITYRGSVIQWRTKSRRGDETRADFMVGAFGPAPPTRSRVFETWFSPQSWGCVDATTPKTQHSDFLIFNFSS